MPLASPATTSPNVCRLPKPANNGRYFQHYGTVAQSLSLDDNVMMESGTPWLLLAALVLGFSAQGFINQMLKGDQGLAAFLKDGSGYNKSAYRPEQSRETSSSSSSDPLPWLSLPKLDFIDVAGQGDDTLVEELERIRQEMNLKLEEKKVNEATKLRDTLQLLMKESGIKYETNDSV
jgi:hypothetical protein